MGWDRMEAEWWPHIAGQLPQPWEPEAAAFDLRWWQGQIRSGETSRMPGRPTLVKRWGWKEKRVRMFLRDRSYWADVTAEMIGARKGPAKGQEGASEGPGSQRGNAPNDPRRASEGPAKGQEGASEGPGSRARDPSSRHDPRSPEHLALPDGVKLGSGVKEAHVSAKVLDVWLAWQEHNPAKKTVRRDQVKVIRAALVHHEPPKLVNVVVYANKAPPGSPYVDNWRSGGYLDVTNLLNSERVDRNVELADDWRAGRLKNRRGANNRPKTSAERFEDTMSYLGELHAEAAEEEGNAGEQKSDNRGDNVIDGEWRETGT